MGAWILWTLQSFYQLQDPIANMTCSRWCQSWWKWWAKSLQSSGICLDAHLRKAAPTKRTLEFAGGDDDAGVDFRTFQEATWSTYALVHMLVRFSTPSRGSSEKSARVQQIWNRWLGALIVRFFGTTTLDQGSREGRQFFTCFSFSTLVVRPGIRYVLWSSRVGLTTT